MLPHADTHSRIEHFASRYHCISVEDGVGTVASSRTRRNRLNQGRYRVEGAKAMKAQPLVVVGGGQLPKPGILGCH